MKARNVRLKLNYNSKDISTDIAPYLLSFQFSDKASGEADDIQINLEDGDKLWESEWFPNKGDTIEAFFIIENWESAGKTEVQLGVFEIDEIEISGLPHVVSIKAISVPNNNDLRGIQRNKAWEKVKLSQIAQEIAEKAGLKLYLNLTDDEEIERLEQREESDLEFLTKTAKEKGCGVKVSDTQLDVYSIAELDKAESVAIIKRNSAGITSYRFQSKTRDIYKGAHIRYENAKDGVFIEYTFNDPDKKEGKILEIHKNVADQKEAEKLAKAELRDKNKDEIKGSLNFGGKPAIGDNLFLAGFTITLEGFNRLDGKYIVESSNHNLSNSGYACGIEIRKCLNGY